MTLLKAGLWTMFGLLTVQGAWAEEAVLLEEVVVKAPVSPIEGGDMDINKIPARVQTVSAEQLQQTQALSLADYMNRYLGSVNINDVQNNPLQPDVQYRGFTVSPLMGLPQGLAVYVNGIRFNEPFGDTVHWDLIPSGAIDRMSLQSASNPAFGLNSLGGSISVQTKTGFTAPGHQLEVTGGSWDRHSEEITSGWNNGEFAYFVDMKYFSEAGWRNHSPSEAKQGLATLSWKGDKTDVDVTLASTDNQLRGNGPLPESMLPLGRKAIFTYPDITRNRLFLASMDVETWLNDDNQLSGNMYYRRNKIRTYNGDGAEFGDCGGFVCDEDGELVEGLHSGSIPFDDDVEGGAINTSQAVQRSFGFALQNAFETQLFNRNNTLVVGASFDNSSVHYSANGELGRLTSDRGVEGSGEFIEEAHVRLHTETQHYGVFLTDTFSITDKLDLTVSGRYNQSHLKLLDQYGSDLNGSHSYNRINPAAGITYKFMPELTVYGNFSESSRVPTPMELSCANPNAPCRLPNAFISDPPLAQVVAQSWEMGFRGRLSHLLQGHLDWHLGFFQTTNSNDIIFQSTGGVGSNTGYFSNVGSTRRRGIELGLNGEFYKRWRWSANYTYLDATFRDAFVANSPANPYSDDNGDIQVNVGDRIPGIPKHLAKFATDFDILPQWTLGFDMHYNGTQFLRGDEANLTAKLAPFVVFNLHSEYRINSHVTLFGKVSNLFDREYANFGTWGNTGSALQDLGFPDDQNQRFVGVSAPRAGWLGIRLKI